MSKRETLIASLCVAASVAGSIALARCSQLDSRKVTASPLPAADGAPCPTDAGPHEDPSKTFLGVLVARNSADIAPRFDGRLASVHVRLGDVVKAGGLIATLDVPSLKFDLRTAQASALSAKVDEERAGVELAQAEEQFARRKALSEAALATGEDLATARYQEKLARTRVDAARAQLAEKSSRVGELQQRSADAELRAPFDGIVAARYLDPGANVTSSTPIVRIISATNLFARFAVPEDEGRRIAVGAPVSVTVGQTTMRGTVEKIAPEIDAASRMIVVEAAVDAAGTNVRSGEMVYVSLEVKP